MENKTSEMLKKKIHGPPPPCINKIKDDIFRRCCCPTAISATAFGPHSEHTDGCCWTSPPTPATLRPALTESRSPHAAPPLPTPFRQGSLCFRQGSYQQARSHISSPHGGQSRTCSLECKVEATSIRRRKRTRAQYWKMSLSTIFRPLSRPQKKKQMAKTEANRAKNTRQQLRGSF